MGRLVVVARGLYLARHLFTLSDMVVRVILPNYQGEGRRWVEEHGGAERGEQCCEKSHRRACEGCSGHSREDTLHQSQERHFQRGGLGRKHSSVQNANFQRIDAEAKVLKLEQELSEAKALQLKLTAKTSFLVSDIRKVQYFPSKSNIEVKGHR